MAPQRYEEKLRKEQTSNKGRNSNRQFGGGRQDFNPNKIPYDKYFVDQRLNNVLVDFEDHMSCARYGGSNSRSLDPADKNKEDIRAPVVQNVSTI